MNFLKITGFVVIVMLMAGCKTVHDPRSLTLSAENPKAILLMKVTKQKLSYNVRITPFDESSNKIEPKYENLARLTVAPGLEGNYVARLVNPGKYVFESFERQNLWATCFNNNTYSFDVKAGDIVYLGDFNSTAHLMQLQNLVIENGDEVSTDKEKYSYFENILVPQFKIFPNLDTDGLAAAKRYVSANMVDVSGDVIPAVYKNAYFAKDSSRNFFCDQNSNKFAPAALTN